MISHSHQDKILAKFLSAIPCAVGFSHHNPEIHTSLGLIKDESSGPVLFYSEEMEDLETIVQFAKAAAIEVEMKADALVKIGFGGKKIKKSGLSKGYGKKVGEVKDCYNTAVTTAAANHTERRKFLRTALKELVLICSDQPGLLGPKALFVLMGFSRDEI